MQSYIPFPDIDNALFRIELFGMEFALRWYALAYIAGILIGWWILRALMRRPALWPRTTAPMDEKGVEDYLTVIVLGVILGGRVGYVLFYQPARFLDDPLAIVRIWEGGMSFHGGMLGVALGLIWFCRARGAPILSVADASAVGTPVGLFLGRLANFVNGELWGRPTTAPWGVLFPDPRAQTCPDWWQGVCARHPSQIYEAILEGLVLFAVMLAGLRLGWLKHPGRMAGTFLAGYGLARFAVEYFRQADPQFVTEDNPVGFVLRAGELGVTRGQLLSLPMIAAGLVLIAASRRAP